VPGLGPRAFQQCAGFLRIHDTRAGHPLDASAVHPERYALVERMAQDLGIEVAALICNQEALSKLDMQRYQGDDVGEYTLHDIRAELQKPGRDPRASFEPPKFRDDVQTLQDLQPGMELEGVVTNVTAFGAFVDVGVHQDGLVHVSQLADKFVKNPSDVVKVGDKLEVRVLEVDLARRRISLSAKKDNAAGGRDGRSRFPHASGSKASEPPAGQNGAEQRPPRAKTSFSHNPFADRLKR
jgi:protein Tex